MNLDISALSERFIVRRLTDADVPAMHETNEIYYQYHAPHAAERSVLGKERFYQNRGSGPQRLFPLSADGAVNLSKGDHHASYLPKGCGIRY